MNVGNDDLAVYSDWKHILTVTKLTPVTPYNYIYSRCPDYILENDVIHVDVMYYQKGQQDQTLRDVNQNTWIVSSNMNMNETDE